MYARIFLLLEVFRFNFFFLYLFSMLYCQENKNKKCNKTTDLEGAASEKDNFPFTRGEVINLAIRTQKSLPCGTGMVPCLNLFIIVRSASTVPFFVFWSGYFSELDSFHHFLFGGTVEPMLSQSISNLFLFTLLAFSQQILFRCFPFLRKDHPDSLGLDFLARLVMITIHIITC
jgi:hypothetical protein